ncbi:Uncharacterised protein [Mycobacteroides abscessus subsp. abscessus]|nr:Uncharacterised protein [Mycobacteroides abscessus subsp. abscessus]
MATPTAAPISRLASLTAAATPCFSTGVAATMAVVAGAVDQPQPGTHGQ